jgi:hypothetical protein
MSAQPDLSQSPVTVRGRLAIKTLHGRNGDFNVGRLQCRLGNFWVKERDLDQYKEGKYSGVFDLDYIGPHAYVASGRSVTEVRAWVLRMALDGVDGLSTDDSHVFSSQVSDPADEEDHSSSAATPQIAAETAPAEAENDGTVSTEAQKPVCETASQSATASDGEEQQDKALFGTLWPLAPAFKLDCTVDRFLIRKQATRLRKLGYELDFHNQEWHRKAA